MHYQKHHIFWSPTRNSYIQLVKSHSNQYIIDFIYEMYRTNPTEETSPQGRDFVEALHPDLRHHHFSLCAACSDSTDSTVYLDHHQN